MEPRASSRSSAFSPPICSPQTPSLGTQEPSAVLFSVQLAEGILNHQSGITWGQGKIVYLVMTFGYIETLVPGGIQVLGDSI